jgi:hypothetical protein
LNFFCHFKIVPKWARIIFLEPSLSQGGHHIICLACLSCLRFWKWDFWNLEMKCKKDEAKTLIYILSLQHKIPRIFILLLIFIIGFLKIFFFKILEKFFFGSFSTFLLQLIMCWTIHSSAHQSHLAVHRKILFPVLCFWYARLISINILLCRDGLSIIYHENDSHNSCIIKTIQWKRINI